MFLDGMGTHIVKTISLNDKFEKIDFKNWLIENRYMNFNINFNGFLLENAKMYIDFSYKSKRYVMNIETNNITTNGHLMIPMIVIEGLLLSGYQIAVKEEVYEKLILGYIGLYREKYNCNSSDEFYKLIINFYNEIIKNGEAFPTNDMYFNQWNYDISDFKVKKSHMEKLFDTYKRGDLVKFTENNTNKVYYAIVGKICKDTEKIEKFKCYSLDYNEFRDDAECFKYLLPPLDFRAQYGRIEKADVSELNSEQKELYDTYAECLRESFTWH